MKRCNKIVFGKLQFVGLPVTSHFDVIKECEAVPKVNWQPQFVFEDFYFIFRVKREFVKKIITFEANGFMVYWSLPCDRSYVERKMY